LAFFCEDEVQNFLRNQRETFGGLTNDFDKHNFFSRTITEKNIPQVPNFAKLTIIFFKERER